MLIGNFRWGVYAFFDYDGEPIYVGQTNERVRTRIRRHLTNQRTDAVAMSVLDPFEVFEIEVWPLPHLQGLQSLRWRGTSAVGCARANNHGASNREVGIQGDPQREGSARGEARCRSAALTSRADRFGAGVRTPIAP